MRKASKVFLIIGMCLTFYLVFPVVLGIFALKKLNEATSSKDLTKWGILSIIFVSVLGGIFMLCIKDAELQNNQVEEKTSKFNSLSYDELSEISNEDHRKDTKEYDKQQNALALVMIGGLSLICGILFLILSVRRVMNKTRGIDTSSLQFFVCIACFAAAVILLSYGLFRFFRALIARKQLRNEIDEISKLRKAHMLEEKKEETL